MNWIEPLGNIEAHYPSGKNTMKFTADKETAFVQRVREARENMQTVSVEDMRTALVNAGHELLKIEAPEWPECLRD